MSVSQPGGNTSSMTAEKQEAKKEKKNSALPGTLFTRCFMYVNSTDLNDNLESIAFSFYKSEN